MLSFRTWLRKNNRFFSLNAEVGLSVVAFMVFLAYAALFCWDVKDFWFNPDWTTDDALQQLFPFFEVLDPEIFKGDLIFTTMKGYLAPLAWWLGAGLTLLTQDPIMTGHWVTLIQIVLSVGFLFLAIRQATGSATPAWLGAAWLLHTRPVMQRLTGGLPRGWASVVIAAYLYFIFRRNHWGVLLTLLCGCLLHPPAALAAAAAYGLFLLVGIVRRSTRTQYLKPLLVFMLLSPVYLVVTYSVVKRPPEVGQMVDSESAAVLPEFQRPHGRFPFLPLESISNEFRMYGYQPFLHRLFNPGRPLKRTMLWIISGCLVVFLLGGAQRRRLVVPLELWSYLVAVLSVYWLSRQVPFHLYVPNRHLQIPMTLFWIFSFVIAIWKLWGEGQGTFNSGRSWFRPAGVYLLLGVLIWFGTGDGLYGSANYNYPRNKRGGVFGWLRTQTPKQSLIAGHPTHIDATQLFAIRRAYATTETAHPFYPRYFEEIKRRLRISLKAHYASNLCEVLELLEPEGVDYFVFSRHRFYPWALEKERYFEPLSKLMQKLTARHYDTYAYKQLPQQVTSNAPYLVYRDDQSAVVDIVALRESATRLGCDALKSAESGI